MTLKKMVKNCFIFALFFLIFTQRNFSLAQAPTPTPIYSQGWFCLKTTLCHGEKYQEGMCTNKSGHRVRLEIDPNNKPLPNINQTYLVECLGVTENNQVKFICTTGDNNFDQQAFGANNFSILQNQLGYSFTHNEDYGIFKVENNQATKIGAKEYKTGPSGGLIIKDSNTPVSIIEWQSYTPQERDRKFYIFQKIPQIQSPDVGQGGQQQATSFDWVNADKDCAVIRWDPVGRVFDALSLEPIAAARVFLTKDDGTGNYIDAANFELGIINPQSTNLQGGFSFFVSDGNYKLAVQNLTSLGYSRMATDISEINSKFNRIYYHEENGLKKTYIYPAQTGELIVQKGKMEYRDIPLIPYNGVGKTYDLKVISVFQSVDRLSGNMIFEGTVSHPFTKITVKGVWQGSEELIYQGVTDNLGRYQVVFSQKKDDKTFENFKVEYAKSDLSLIAKKKTLFHRLINLLTKHLFVFGQNSEQNSNTTASINLDPLPTYLEGVAYDEGGKVIPNAQVKIFIKGMNVPYSIVNTDANGYYKISSNNLPSLPYEIKYQDALGRTISVSTGKFITQNQNLVATKKLNFYSLKDLQGRPVVVTPKTTQSPLSSPLQDWERGSQAQTGGSLTLSPTKAKEISNPFNSGVVLILAVIFFLTLTAGVIIFFYLRQKNSSSTVI